MCRTLPRRTSPWTSAPCRTSSSGTRVERRTHRVVATARPRARAAVAARRPADARRWLIAGLGFWLLASLAALALAGAPGSRAQSELIVESVKTDAYPRVTARFRIEPEVGRPPGHLEPRDVVIIEGAARREPLEVYVVGRAPTERVGTYEAVWSSGAAVQPGEAVVARLIVARLNRGDLEGEVRFTRPLPRVGGAEAVPIERRNELKPVPLPSAPATDVGYVGSVAAVLAGVATLCAAAAIAWRSRVRYEQERLAVWVAGSTASRARLAARANRSGRRQARLSPLVVKLGKLGARLQPASHAEKLKRNLVLAGRGTPQEYTRFLAIKAGLGLVLLVLGLWLLIPRGSLLNAVALSGCLGMLGFLLPSYWLGKQIKARQYEIKKSLPDALDLMTIGVSAGLAFDGAIAEIVNKWDNHLGREFNLMLGELRMGTGRREALLHLADRTQVDEVQTMVAQLIQSEELGMSLTDTLLTLSGQMRLKRRQRAEELAQKAAVKMLIPLVFLIFPALFIVILGPSVQDMYTFLTATGGGK
jgi:tight adherence protein C